MRTGDSHQHQYLAPPISANDSQPRLNANLVSTEYLQSSLYFWLGQTYILTRRNIDDHDELTQPVLGPGDGATSLWGRGGSGDQAHPPRRRDQPEDFGPASLPAPRWKISRNFFVEMTASKCGGDAEEMMHKQGEEKKCQ